MIIGKNSSLACPMLRPVVTMFLCLFASLCWAQTSADAFRGKISDAIVCLGKNSAEAIYDLERDKMQMKRHGISYRSNKAPGLDHQVTIDFRDPLLIGGAHASRIRLSLDANDFKNFGAVVYAEFVGNQQRIIDMFRLNPPNDEYPVYTRARLNGQLCPPTIELLPLGKDPSGQDRFALGCGWCNG